MVGELRTPQIFEGDCLEVMAGFPDCSVDAIVTDPPYSIGFMGKGWDQAFGHLPWTTEALRVAKPGAHLLAFGGTRTYHRLACAIEDAGWEIRDCLVWAYGSGFPKSLSPYRSTMAGLCKYHALAPHAVRISPWRLLGSREAREPSALALAEIQPEGDLALLIRTGEEDASFGVMATSLSGLPMGDTNSSTEWSWRASSDGHWQTVSTSIIEMAAKAITEPRTWSFWTSPIMLTATPEDVSRPDGCQCAALTVVNHLSDGRTSSRVILWPSVAEPVTWPLASTQRLGTAAKPAWEPIVMARKPLRGTVAANVAAYGTGALNIDATRIGAEPDDFGAGGGSKVGSGNRAAQSPTSLVGSGVVQPMHTLGRWPANVILTNPIFDGDTPGVVGGGETGPAGIAVRHNVGKSGGNFGFGAANPDMIEDVTYGDSGTYSRFFLIPKADRAEREPVLGGLDQSVSPRIESAHSTVCAKCGRQRVNVPGAACSCVDPEWIRKPQTARANTHPTVKPVELMRHLIRLVTPSGGVVLDPFLGSGTTAIAAEMEGFPWIGIEKEPEYVAIAKARLLGTQRGLGLLTEAG